MLPAPSAAESPGPVLHWVTRGTARATGTDVDLALATGDALWVPVGADVRLRRSWDAVIVPITGLSPVDGPAHVLTITVGESGRDAMVHAFGASLGYLETHGEDPVLARLVEILRLRAEHGLAPVWPTTHALVDWCRATLAEGTATLPPGWTPRTLGRRMTAETGRAPSVWVRESRLAEAADALACGSGIARAAAVAHFFSVSGFTRAFRAFTGVSPSEWAELRARVSAPAVLDLDACTDALPARSTWGRINSFHVAVWLARGNGTVRIGTTELRLEAGEALVLPAGIPNDVDLEPGSVLLPVGFRSPVDCPRGVPVAPARIDARAAADVIHAAVAAYTGGEAECARAGFDLVSDRQQAPVRPEHAVLARLASVTPHDTAISLAACAEAAGESADDVRDAIADATGLAFVQWQRRLRMSRARGVLWRGVRPGRVAADFGYAHQPAFTRAFREVHGRTPQAASAGPWASVTE